MQAALGVAIPIIWYSLIVQLTPSKLQFPLIWWFSSIVEELLRLLRRSRRREPDVRQRSVLDLNGCEAASWLLMIQVLNRWGWTGRRKGKAAWELRGISRTREFCRCRHETLLYCMRGGHMLQVMIFNDG